MAATTAPISVGPMEGHDFNITAIHIRPLAVRILEQCAKVKNMRMWFEKASNTYFLGFDLGDDHYQLAHTPRVSGPTDVEVRKNHHDTLLEHSFDDVVSNFANGEYVNWWHSPYPHHWMSVEKHVAALVKRAYGDRISRGESVKEPYYRQMDDIIYLGHRSGEGIVFQLAIHVSENKVYKHSGEVICSAAYLHTAIQYALQEYQWTTS